MQLRSRVPALAVLAAAMAAGLPAQAVTLGQLDGFQGGSNNGWASGAANNNGPVNVASGGPAGAGDGYLLATAVGGGGAGSRLVVFNQAQWLGNYVAAGVTSISMDLNNLGSTALEIHLQFIGSAGNAVSGGATLAPGSGWQHLSFSLAAGALSGNAAALLDVTELRLFHGPGTPAIAVAQLGLDNVSAVPMPAGAPLALAGLGAVMAAVRRRRPRRSGH